MILALSILNKTEHMFVFWSKPCYCWYMQAGGALRVQRGRWRDPMLKLTRLLLAAAVLLALALLAYEILLG